jgi:hypothetical protein
MVIGWASVWMGECRLTPIHRVQANDHQELIAEGDEQKERGWE